MGYTNIYATDKTANLPTKSTREKVLMDYRQICAIKRYNKERILKCCPGVPERSGIYFLTREENGFKWAYIGKAKHLLTRLTEHLSGYQHIDLSIKKHHLWSADNQCGWKVHFLEYPESVLDEMEQKYIKAYANAGYQMRNHESGGTAGKVALENRQSSKGYYDGLKQGEKNARKFVKNLFDKHLNYSQKSEKPNKNQEKAMQKFKEFLEADDDTETEDN